MQDEKTLIREIRKAPEQFGILYDRYFQVIFNYVFKRCGNFELARDITSETFLKAYLKIHGFRWRGISIRNWLFRIATNEVNLYFRNKKYDAVLQNEIYNQAVYNPGSAKLSEERSKAELEMERQQQFKLLQQAVLQLPVKYQEVITLRYFEQLKIREIARILNKKEGTVKSLISRGLVLLREKINATF